MADWTDLWRDLRDIELGVREIGHLESVIERFIDGWHHPPKSPAVTVKLIATPLGEGTSTMASVGPKGVSLAVVGYDVKGGVSQDGVGPATFTLNDPASSTVLTPAADGFSATLVPNAGVDGSGSVTATGTLAGQPDYSVTYDFVVVGPAATVQLVATPLA